MNLNSNPKSNNFCGIALCPSVKTRAPSLKIRFKTNSGTGNNVGLFNVFPKAFVKPLLVVGTGAERLKTSSYSF